MSLPRRRVNTRTAWGADRAFFGRRKGKRLRDAQETRLETLLPALRIDLPPGSGRIDPRTLFGQMDPRRTRSGWRSGSAAASTLPPGPRSIPGSASSAPKPS